MCQAPKLFLASDVEATVERVAAGSHAWAALGVEGRLRHLHTLRSKLSHADFAAWTAGSIHAQGLDPNSDLGRAQQVAEMMTMSAVAAGELGRIADTCKRLAAGRAPALKLRRSATSEQVVCSTFPVTRYDKWCNPLALAGFSSEVWLAPGAEPTQGGEALKTSSTADGGRVCVVLGAGNQDFLTLVDCIDKLFVRGCAVIVKHHPVRQHQHEHFLRCFEPLIELGVFASVVGDAEVGAKLVHHESVASVHLTGGVATHDAIVWGGAPSAAAPQPMLTKPITSELGCVTPYIITPDAAWTTKQLTHHAWQLANACAAQAHCNCLSPQALLIAGDWEHADAFVATLKDALRQIPMAVPYYPGVQKRHAKFAEHYGDRAERIGESLSPGAAADAAERFGEALPLLLIDLAEAELEAGELAISEEAFAPVLAVVRLAAKPTAEDFLPAATAFANERCWGNLSCTLVLHPASEAAAPAAVDAALESLRYGIVAINAWSSLAYAMETASWGGYHVDNKLDDVRSGVGVVRNCLMLDHALKSVVRTPFLSKLHLTQKIDDFSIGPRMVRAMAWMSKVIARYA